MIVNGFFGLLRIFEVSFEDIWTFYAYLDFTKGQVNYRGFGTFEIKTVPLPLDLWQNNSSRARLPT